MNSATTKPPVKQMKRCGLCRWHFDLTGHTEHAGLKNCLAQPAASCMEILSTEEADCNRPEDFQPSERTSYL